MHQLLERHRLEWKSQYTYSNHCHSKCWKCLPQACDRGHICHLKCCMSGTLPLLAQCSILLVQVCREFLLTLCYIYVRISHTWLSVSHTHCAECYISSLPTFIINGKIHHRHCVGKFSHDTERASQFQMPRSIRHGSEAACLL